MADSAATPFRRATRLIVWLGIGFLVAEAIGIVLVETGLVR